MSLLLREDDTDVQQVATHALTILVRCAGNQPKIIEAGAVAPLVQLLKSVSEDLKVAAAVTLVPIAFKARSEIIAAGAIEPLVGMLSSESEGAQLAATLILVDISFENTARPGSPPPAPSPPSSGFCKLRLALRT